jgi:hypothetical protein
MMFATNPIFTLDLLAEAVAENCRAATAMVGAWRRRVRGWIIT